MAVTCEKCGRPTRSKKDRFCPKHAKAMLKLLADRGYLEPLEQRTISGPFRLAPKGSLSVETDQFDPTSNDFSE